MIIWSALTESVQICKHIVCKGSINNVDAFQNFHRSARINPEVSINPVNPA